MATTARKTTATRKTAASKPTKPAEPVEEPKVEETTAEEPTVAVETSGDEAPVEAAAADEAPVEAPVVESEPASDEADAPAEESEESEEDAVEDEPAADDFAPVTRENAAEVIGRRAIAASGDVPGTASEHPDTGVAVREAPDLQHAPLEAPTPLEAPAQPVAADAQFGDVAVTLLRPDAFIVDEATGKAPVAPLFSDVTFGVVLSHYRLIEKIEIAGRPSSRLLIAKGARLSQPAAARIEEYVLAANADED